MESGSNADFLVLCHLKTSEREADLPPVHRMMMREGAPTLNVGGPRGGGELRNWRNVAFHQFYLGRELQAISSHSTTQLQRHEQVLHGVYQCYKYR